MDSSNTGFPPTPNATASRRRQWQLPPATPREGARRRREWQTPAKGAVEATNIAPVKDLTEVDAHDIGIILAARLSDPNIKVYLAAMECLGDHILDFVPLLVDRFDDECKKIRYVTLRCALFTNCVYNFFSSSLVP